MRGVCGSYLLSLLSQREQRGARCEECSSGPRRLSLVSRVKTKCAVWGAGPIRRLRVCTRAQLCTHVHQMAGCYRGCCSPSEAGGKPRHAKRTLERACKSRNTHPSPRGRGWSRKDRGVQPRRRGPLAFFWHTRRVIASSSRGSAYITLTWGRCFLARFMAHGHTHGRANNKTKARGHACVFRPIGAHDTG